MDMSQFNAAEQATLAKAIEAKQVSSTVADGVPPICCSDFAASYKTFAHGRSVH